MLEEALRYNVLPRTVYAALSNLSERAEQLVSHLQARGVRTMSVSQRELTALADTDSPQGVVAVFDRPVMSLGQLWDESTRKVVWCPDIADPGNLGTIIRTALAFGLDLVIVGEAAVEPYSPKVIRSSAGAALALPIAVATAKEVLDMCQRMSMDLIVADSRPEEALSIDELVSGSFVLALGSEAHGVDAEISEAATVRVRIPHADKVESLNVAVAGAILMQRLYG